MSRRLLSNPVVLLLLAATAHAAEPREIGSRTQLLLDERVIAASRNVRTRRGEWMQFITLEDEHDLLEATLFPKAHRAFSALLHSLGPYLLEGTVENDRGMPSLNVSRVEAL